MALGLWLLVAGGEIAAGASLTGDALLRARIEAAPRLPLQQTALAIDLPAGETLGMVSWLAHDPGTGLTWLLHRGDQAPPVLAVDSHGRVVHAFGRGRFTIPHAIRLDPEGAPWTVDAGSSRILHFSPDGRVRLQFDVDGPAHAAGAFAGATDIAFTAGHAYITDGYVHARILEYTMEGRKVRQWGTPGRNPGQFHLPHSIAVGPDGALYVADRENGRIQVFDARGRFLREINPLGRVLAVQPGLHGVLWAAVAPADQPPGAAGWILEISGADGRMLGVVPVNDAPALHCIALAGDGEPMTDIGNRVVVFRHRS